MGVATFFKRNKIAKIKNKKFLRGILLTFNIRVRCVSYAIQNECQIPAAVPLECIYVIASPHT